MDDLGRARAGARRGRARALQTATGAAAWLVLCSVLDAQSAETRPFPRVERAVAPIITSAYSSEAERDGKGEGERVMQRLRVEPGLRVADIGAGDGYYTVRLARRLGRGATIYAQDVEPRYLDRLAARLLREEVTGVSLVLGTPEDPRLPGRSVDLAILAHMYHEIAHPYAFLYRLHAALAPGGRLAVVDNDKPTRDHGTPPVLLRCELGALGYRQIELVSLAPADGYLAVFASPEALPDPSAIRPCPRS